MSSQVKLLGRDESGTMTIVSAFALSVVMGVAALAITTADAYSIRSKTQNALDAAVLSAAALPYGTSEADRIAFAEKIYQGNASKRGNSSPEVAVGSSAPAAFTVAGTEVFGTVEFPMTSPFLGVLSGNALTIKATSGARKRQGSPVCVLGLDPTEAATIDFNGKASLEVLDCAVQANSSDGAGINQVGSPSMTARQIGVTGGYTGSAYSPQPTVGTTPISARIPQVT